ncbi:YjbQ family protein [Candidatus Poribacteria bacterium]|nr:MAG: YjbQ family protein [Candidatus Poribacteria bacterium]
MIHTLTIRTKSKVEFVDITQQVREIVRKSGVREGVCYVYAPHTTAAVTINENADPSVVRDIIDALDRLVPQAARYSHLEGNAPAHIKSTLVGASEVILVEGGDLVLGTWQGIFFCEFDGPRTRRVLVKVVEG